MLRQNAKSRSWGQLPCHCRPSALLLALASGLTLLSACKRTEEVQAPDIRPVRTIKIEQRAAPGSVVLTGTVQAQKEINLSFRIDGRLIERSVNLGDQVRRAQVIATLDPHDEETALQAARARLTGALAQQNEAHSTHERMQYLVSQKAVPAMEFDRAEAAAKVADSAVETARSDVALAESRLGYTRLVSDVAGTVTDVGAEPGEVIRAGIMVVEVAEQGSRDAVLDLPAAVKDTMLQNPNFTIALTMNPTVTALGRVREVSPRADPVTGTFRIRVSLLDPPAAMRLGSTVTAATEHRAIDGYVIPASALVRSDQKSAVWIVDPKEMTVAMQTVEVKDFEPNQVLASGVKPGDIVVTSGVQALRPGQKVRLLESQ